MVGHIFNGLNFSIFLGVTQNCIWEDINHTIHGDTRVDQPTRMWVIILKGMGMERSLVCDMGEA